MTIFMALGARAGHDNSAENSEAFFMRGGDRQLMSYCWRIAHDKVDPI
jgi:hypothetical protein